MTLIKNTNLEYLEEFQTLFGFYFSIFKIIRFFFFKPHNKNLSLNQHNAQSDDSQNTLTFHLGLYFRFGIKDKVHLLCIILDR